MPSFSHLLTNHLLSPYPGLVTGETKSGEGLLPLLEEKGNDDFPSIDCLLWAGYWARSFTFNPYNNPLETGIIVPILKIRGLKFR